VRSLLSDNVPLRVGDNFGLFLFLGIRDSDTLSFSLLSLGLLNPDGGRLKLGSLASNRCTGLVAKYTVGPLSLDTQWAAKAVFNHQQEYTSQPPSKLSAPCTLLPDLAELSARCKSQPPARLSASSTLLNSSTVFVGR
jgi:hypothetical protein